VKRRLRRASVAPCGVRQDEADELAVAAWNARMAEGGPAQPSPTLRVALERGCRYLQVRCQACCEATFIDLAEVRPTGRHASVEA
jgi:hypothetical protein